MLHLREGESPSRIVLVDLLNFGHSATLKLALERDFYFTSVYALKSAAQIYR